MNIHTIDPDTMPLRRQLFVGGASCVVSTDSPAVLKALSRWSHSRDIQPARFFDLTVSVDPFLKHDCDGTPHFRGREHLVLATFGERALFVFDLRRRLVTGIVSQQTAGDWQFWNHLLLPIALGVLGTAMGLVPVHAACLDWNGKGLMIAGTSGAGKSTLAVALSQRGFSLISDDWTYVAQEDGGVTAYGVSAPVKLLPDALSFFPELDLFQPAKSLNGEMAFEVDAARTFGSATCSQTQPKTLVLLERRQCKGCEVTPHSPQELVAFFENSVERLPGFMATAAARRSAIIRECAQENCWLLRYGGPPQIAADALRQLCGGL